MPRDSLNDTPGIVILGGTIITMDPATGIVEDGYVTISGTSITAVGRASELESSGTWTGPPTCARTNADNADDGSSGKPARSSAHVLDARGMIVLPGFINAHHHLWQSILRGLGPNMAVREWVNECVSTYGPRFSPNDSYWASLLALVEAVDSGVTTIVNWAHNGNSLEHVDASIRAFRDSGVRGIYAFGSRILPNREHEMPYRMIEEALERLFDPGDPMLTPWLAPPEPGFGSSRSFERALEFARARGLRLSIHLLESEAEMAARPLHVLSNADALGPGLLIAHAVHVDQTEIRLLAETRTPVVHCPVANMRLASGIMPLRDMLARGVTVGLGTDGLASNDSGDMFAVMKTALGMARASTRDPKVLSPDEALYLGTMGGAKAIGMDHLIGSIAVGKKADIIIVNPQAINFAPVNDCISQLVLCGAPSNVHTVMVNGRVLKHEGRLLNVDLSELIAEVTRSADRVVRGKNRRGRQGVSRTGENPQDG